MAILLPKWDRYRGKANALERLDYSHRLSNGLLVDLFSSTVIDAPDISNNIQFSAQLDVEFLSDGTIRGPGLTGGSYRANITPPTQNFTLLVSGIYYDSAAFGVFVAIGKPGADVSQKSLLLQSGGTAGQIRAQVINSSGTVVNTSTVTTMSSGDQYIFAVRYDGSSLTIKDLISGASQSASASGNLKGGVTLFQIAGAEDNAGVWTDTDVDAQVDRIRLWNRVLDDADVFYASDNAYDALKPRKSYWVMPEVAAAGGNLFVRAAGDGGLAGVGGLAGRGGLAG